MAIGFGIVGLGMGYSRAKQVINTEGAELVAVCDINEERLKKACEEFKCEGYSDFDRMLKNKDVDVVYVMTPSGTHLDFGKKAAEAGKHVITTKPMEVSVQRCKEFIRVCKRSNVEIVVDFEMRYRTELQQLKAAIESDELGEIIFAEARCKWWRTQEYYNAGGWRGTWKYDGGGSAANQGIHVIDLLVWLCGDPKNILFSRYGVFAHDIETEDLTLAIMELENGNFASITTTTNHHLGDDYGVAISFENGSISNQTGTLKIKMKDGTERLKTEIPDLPRNAAEDMIRTLEKKEATYVSGYEGLRSIKLLDRIYKKGKKYYRNKSKKTA
ncbi:MAG: Gfo/Idh/MocA family oxidoreductase [Candidatus Omnitrophica bacterium]|nr:Gfo/Idh/MocA family oxidoreductase [Candidatus Omnitrophota bacterium]MCM8829053.1 Gfo/Idh/MocA family oxidoreductase [Candidatus Omnitrophota bacterium]